MKRPVIELGPDSSQAEIEKVVAWVRKNNIRVLNIAGPREESIPGIYSRAVTVLRKIIRLMEFPKAGGNGD